MRERQRRPDRCISRQAPPHADSVRKRLSAYGRCEHTECGAGRSGLCGGAQGRTAWVTRSWTCACRPHPTCLWTAPASRERCPPRLGPRSVLWVLSALLAQRFPPARPQVHTGFAERAATIPLLPFVHALRPTSADTPAKRLFFCGHSMGGGVAALVALRLVTQATAFRYNPFETSVVASAAQPASAQRRVGLYERDASLAVRVALPPPLPARAVSDAGRWERRMGAGGRRRC